MYGSTTNPRKRSLTKLSIAGSSQATVLMDLHAHLSSTEVIGLLGGVWKADGRHIEVVRAFPCRRALGSQSGTSVELDPSAEVETRALMQAEDLTPVGWCAPHRSQASLGFVCLIVRACKAVKSGRCTLQIHLTLKRMPCDRLIFGSTSVMSC